jgi:predicted TIM-barrel fold metal-dependent hydrolase
MVACLILHNLFGRYPDLRMLSIENGSTWVPDLLKDMDKSAKVTVSTQGAKRTKWIGGPITDRPSELFKRHFWVAPFYEDPVPALVEQIGAERVLFGSDWPHPEGVREPLDFVQECDGLAPGALRRVMRENTAELLGLRTRVI